MTLNIEGIQKAQQANLKAIAAVQPGGAFGKAIKDVTVGSYAYELKIMHVDSGGMKASARMEARDYRGLVFIDESAYGPNGAPIEYAPYEHARGGEHAFAERTVKEAGADLSRDAMKTIMRGALYGR